jgi:hypothetical protein
LRKLGLKRAAIGVFGILLLFAFIPIIVSILVLNQREHRIDILSKGTQIIAEVTRADSKGYRRKCKVEYRYSFDGTIYNGSVIGCDMMISYPKGSSIPVRFFTNDPSYSIVEGDTFWPIETPIMIFAWLAWFMAAALLLFLLGRDALSHLRKQIRRKRRPQSSRRKFPRP